MSPEIQAYQHARSTWERFRATFRFTAAEAESLFCEEPTGELVDRFLLALPPDERRPVAFGFFLRHAGRWSPLRQSSFLGGFLPAPLAAERTILEAAVRGVPDRPGRLPVTLEEFPSRIWKRALASRRPHRLAAAAHLAFRAAASLHEEYREGLDPDEEGNVFLIPSGDVPADIDLIALTPASHRELKARVLSQLLHDVTGGRRELTTEQLAAIRAWSLVDTGESALQIETLAAKARETMASLLIHGRLRDHHHTRRLGRLMFRLGFRRLASQCAKCLGDSPWELGWQHQSIAPAAHARIRGILLRRGGAGEAWRTDPALACSAMSLPLWLADGVARLSELAALFNRAEACPWIFPRLQPVFQWHLAIAGRTADLLQVERLDPGLAAGLSREPQPAIP